MSNIVLLSVIVFLIVLIALQTSANRKDVLELKAENKDLLNRLLAKSTSDYKALTHVKEVEEPKYKKSFEEQLMEEGALIPGYPSPYPRDL
jgi:hypothetical protein